uniref:Uncharacterized protein n=1 Tax=viral metagenome TaxID=1070528 RepID=A0A6M3IQC7_9ZZZZ
MKKPNVKPVEDPKETAAPGAPKESTEYEKAFALVVAKERERDEGFAREYEVLCRKWGRKHGLIPAQLGVGPYNPGTSA